MNAPAKLDSDKPKSKPHRDGRHERTQETILEAAARAFARRGYHASTMNDIASEAGYTAPTLYSYFEGKQHIFESLVTSVVGELNAAFDEILPEGLTFGQRLELLLRRMYAAAERRRDAIRFLMKLQSGLDAGPAPEPNQSQADHMRTFTSRFTKWIEVAEAKSGEQFRYDPHTMALSLSALSNAMVCEWISSDGPLQERVPMVLDLFLYGVAEAPTDPTNS